ncbi:hypothetical protein MIND_01232900 [Mycena indigotica]|uniref:Uncharacterized protein n=1 Tax=Mycena indigotica TaxID=2126181 RepID=A0A8H6VVW7_9AGAR|nr:uncharacterized protein MIND_01232900 [Mycena indigotica]KAF7292068.1 hypothetical protein MIND_01232900 [Mycena indigotica]
MPSPSSDPADTSSEPKGPTQTAVRRSFLGRWGLKGSFFSKSSNVTVASSTLIVDNRRFFSVRAREPKIDKKSHLEEVDASRVELLKEITVRKRTRLHWAKVDGRAGVVRVYDGPDAVKRLNRDVQFNLGVLHSNHLKIIGTSPKRSPDTFAVYQGDIRMNAAHKVASFLRGDLMEVLILSCRMAHDIAVVITSYTVSS